MTEHQSPFVPDQPPEDAWSIRHAQLLAQVVEYEATRDGMLAEGARLDDPNLNFLLGKLSVASDELIRHTASRTVDIFEETQ